MCLSFLVSRLFVVFAFLKSEYDMLMLSVLFCFVLAFSLHAVLAASCNGGLSSIISFWKCSDIVASNISLPFSLSSPGAPTVCIISFVVIPQFLDIMFCPFYSFFCVSVVKISIVISSSSENFSLAVVSLLMSPLKSIIHFCYGGVFSQPFVLIHWVPVSLLTLLICSYICPLSHYTLHQVIDNCFKFLFC